MRVFMQIYITKVSKEIQGLDKNILKLSDVYRKVNRILWIFLVYVMTDTLLSLLYILFDTFLRI